MLGTPSLSPGGEVPHGGEAPGGGGGGRPESRPAAAGFPGRTRLGSCGHRRGAGSGPVGGKPHGQQQVPPLVFSESCGEIEELDFR